MNHLRAAGNLKKKLPITDGGLRMFALPLFFVLCFYGYFLVVSFMIYDAFGLTLAWLLAELPHLFCRTYFEFFLFAIIFSIMIQVRKLFIVLFPVFMFLIGSVYLIQYFSLYYINDYIIPEAYFHLEDAHLLIKPVMLVFACIGALVFLAIISTLAWLLSARPSAAGSCGYVKATLWRFAVTGVCFGLVATPGFLGEEHIKERARLYGVPGTTPHGTFVSVLKSVIFEKSGVKKAVLPADVNTFLAKKFGFSYQLDREYPMVKNRIYSGQLPFERRKTGTGRQPNVILFFMESLSTRYLEAGSRRGLTPNMDAFATEAMSIKNYYNHTFPTINGIRGQLCSYYPFLGENDYSDHGLVKIKLLGLPEILNRYGYETIMFSYFNDLYSPNPGHVINMKLLLTECGFSKLFMARDIQKHLLDVEDLSFLGNAAKPSINDLGLMTDLVKFLRENKGRKNPLMITVATKGTHITVQNSQQEILDMLSKLDKAFGIFWNYFRSSTWYENTMVVLTADHAMPPTVGYRKLIGSNQIGLFDELTCFVFDRRYRLPQSFEMLSSSLDLAPTLLHFLGINDVKTPFQGLSIFAGRKNHPAAFCTLRNRIYVKDKDGIADIPCPDGSGVLERYLSDPQKLYHSQEKRVLALKVWYAYNVQININNRIWSDFLDP